MNMKKLLLISMMLMTVLAMAACEDSGDEPFTPEHPELSDHRVGKMRMNPKFRMYLHCR